MDVFSHPASEQQIRDPPDPSPCIRWSGFLGPAKGVKICTIRSRSKASNYARQLQSIGTTHPVEASAQQLTSRPDPPCRDPPLGYSKVILDRRLHLSRRFFSDKGKRAPKAF